MFAAVHTPGGADLSRLAQCASDFSPLIEETAPDTVTFAVDGLAHLFGPPREVAAAIARRAAELGLAAHVAVADNPDLAVHGARGFAGVTVMDAEHMAGLSIAVLAPPEDIAQTFALWGIRTCGELAALPADGVAERLGEAGVRLQQLARGAAGRPLVPAFPVPPFVQSMELEYPLAELEPLSFLLARLLNGLCAHLESRGLAAHELTLRLALEGGGLHERTLRLPYPMRAARTFLKLLALDLEMHPPDASIVAVTLSAEPVNPRVVQHGLFIPLAPEPQKLELTLARITKLVGEGNAGSPQLLDTHRPRAFRLMRFKPGTVSSFPVFRAGEFGEGNGERGYCPGFCLRAFRPERRAVVTESGGRPAEVRAQGVRGRVLESAGPWRTSGDWWRSDAWARDEWDVALSDGALYLLSRDGPSGEWFIEGSYD
jgi:protein ImuB